jgi:hypothetical protein
VATFVVEMYLPRGRAGERSQLDRRAREAATSLSAEGVPVRHVRSVFVPEDEMCLCFFEAPAAAVVAEASRRAGLSYERIVETQESGLPIRGEEHSRSNDTHPATTGSIPTRST